MMFLFELKPKNTRLCLCHILFSRCVCLFVAQNRKSVTNRQPVEDQDRSTWVMLGTLWYFLRLCSRLTCIRCPLGAMFSHLQEAKVKRPIREILVEL